jgi:hypothetical protein
MCSRTEWNTIRKNAAAGPSSAHGENGPPAASKRLGLAMIFEIQQAATEGINAGATQLCPPHFKKLQ